MASAPISIKVNIDQDVAPAMAALDCTGTDPIRRNIWFAEAHDARPGIPAPLFDSGMIIRLRSGEFDDLTVKVAPCVPRELPDSWQQPFEVPAPGAQRAGRIDPAPGAQRAGRMNPAPGAQRAGRIDPDGFAFHLKHDWCHDRRWFTASAMSRRPPGTLAAAIDATGDPTHLLDVTQRLFVVGCTSGGVPIDRLITLGPIRSALWRCLDIDGLPVTAELWSVRDVETLELSTTVAPIDQEPMVAFAVRAAQVQQRLHGGLERRGISVSALTGKTGPLIDTLARCVR
ncbi:MULTISPECIES: hypothetical protein [unclassified Gordonia (in: high G+C Gram-positive bacteria)]